MKKTSIFLIVLSLLLLFVITTNAAELDWRDKTYNGQSGDWTTVAKNQGSCGSCWDFAACGALESVMNINASDPTLDRDISEQYVLSCNDIGAGDCDGGSYLLSLYYMRDNGSLPESCFAYTGSDATPCSNKCVDWESQLMFNISSVGGGTSCNATILKQYLEDGPIIINYNVMDDFYYSTGDENDGYGDDSYDTNGVYKYDGVSSYSDNDHCIVIVGYNDTPANGDYDGYWICKNSWGSSWGPWSDGYFGFAYNQTLYDNIVEDSTRFPILKDGPPSTMEIGGLDSDNITWTANENSVVWSNQTVPGGTMTLNFSANASSNYTQFNLLITDLSVDIPKENISIQVLNTEDGSWSTDTKSFPASGNITIDSYNWTTGSWCRGTNPFPIVNKAVNLEIRFKLILGTISSGVYSKSDWEVLYNIE